MREVPPRKASAPKDLPPTRYCQRARAVLFPRLTVNNIVCALLVRVQAIQHTQISAGARHVQPGSHERGHAPTRGRFQHGDTLGRLIVPGLIPT
jgi:hypothetical protein